MLVKRQSGFLGILLTWLLSAVALVVSAKLVPGVHLTSFGTALVVALVLGLLNAVVRPMLVFFTLPLTVVTLGLFLLVINGAMVLLAARFIDGFAVDGWWPAILMALVVSAVSWVLGFFFGSDERR